MDCGGIKAILLDLDNTLIDTAGAGRVAIQNVTELLKSTLGDKHNISDICDSFKRKLFDETFDPTSGRTIDEVRIGHWEESIHEIMAEGAGSSLASECYYLWKNTRLELLTITAPVLTMLKLLRKKQKLLLLTNGETQTQREKVVAVGCEGLFDAVVVGGEHAEEKPALSIFSHCFGLLGVQATDCVMVGDSLDTDIAGGANAGVRATVWINNTGSSSEGLTKPDYTIPSVLDLPEVLAKLDETADK
ncbi:N-acylneuraminate-9-phosphatase [Esox lucius]|uniref:N-acetylneuraminic acid phosphatase n=1 Tax=Esox lucius TaxID=8010 RepID=A0AAY5L726_ESOLU|nr:N-acylneuraminate-9-phosphatase [Esox lucius]